MRARDFWRTVTVDRTDFLDRLLSTLSRHGVRFCVIGGQAVNAYVEPLVSLDLDLVIAPDQVEEALLELAREFEVSRFPFTANVSAPGSDLRVQISTAPIYASFVDRAEIREVLGLRLPVARLEDVLAGKVAAAREAGRRPSKRRKDLLDIERLLEAYPALRTQVPGEVLDRLG
jgi:Nucleotidyl transferase AbiEii toxin, Type IV TA system